MGHYKMTIETAGEMNAVWLSGAEVLGHIHPHDSTAILGTNFSIIDGGAYFESALVISELKNVGVGLCYIIRPMSSLAPGHLNGTRIYFDLSVQQALISTYPSLHNMFRACHINL